MTNYTNLDAFLTDLPALTEPLRDKLRGRDNLFCILTEKRKVYIRLRDGVLTMPEAPQDPPVCTVNATEDKLLGLITGRENPVKLLLFGGVKVKGDAKPLMSLARLLG